MYKRALTLLTILFFIMGFITCLNDILIPYLKNVFALDYAQSALIQFHFFGAYGLMSIPASMVVEKWGYQRGMVVGFLVSAVGCLLFFPAVSFHAYKLFLFALFILATGIVLLQVAANPYVSILGPKESASSRLNMVQAFNSLGTFLAPFFGSFFILSKITNTTNASAVKYPYLFIAVVLMGIALLLSRSKLPTIETTMSIKGAWKNVVKDHNLLLGVIGIFSYVGAEVTIGSFLVNYIVHRLLIHEADAAAIVALYWGGAMVGRFVGIYTLKKFVPGRVLLVHACIAIMLVLISINTRGALSIGSMICVGLCHSIMFPTIFTLGIKDVASGVEQLASGFLATAILGGAILPVLTGWIVDKEGFEYAFLLPIICYIYISYFGFKHKAAIDARSSSMAKPSVKV